MKEIKLTQGQVAIVDDEDFEELNKFKWRVRWPKYVYQSARAVRGVKSPNGKHNTVSMSTDILRLKSNDRQCITYRNGNKLDNRKENLKPKATAEEILALDKEIADYKEKLIAKNKKRKLKGN